MSMLMTTLIVWLAASAITAPLIGRYLAHRARAYPAADRSPE